MKNKIEKLVSNGQYLSVSSFIRLAIDDKLQKEKVKWRVQE
jgi:Arc/MetJ-type ribon-helix-helix transcriptional regulator